MGAFDSPWWIWALPTVYFLYRYDDNIDVHICVHNWHIAPNWNLLNGRKHIQLCRDLCQPTRIHTFKRILLTHVDSLRENECEWCEIKCEIVLRHFWSDTYVTDSCYKLTAETIKSTISGKWWQPKFIWMRNAPKKQIAKYYLSFCSMRMQQTENVVAIEFNGIQCAVNQKVVNAPSSNRENVMRKWGTTLCFHSNQTFYYYWNGNVKKDLVRSWDLLFVFFFFLISFVCAMCNCACGYMYVVCSAINDGA